MKKRRIIIFSLLFVLSAVLICISVFGEKETNISNDIFFDLNSVNGIEYKSEEHNFNKCSAYVYAFLKDSSDNKKENEFVISVIRTSKTQEDNYYVSEYASISDEIILNPDYNNIDDFAMSELHDGEDYYGLLYAGIAPKSCKQITVNGIKAYLVPMTFELNGKTADFNLYYCFVDDGIDDNPEIIAVDENENKIEI